MAFETVGRPWGDICAPDVAVMVNGRALVSLLSDIIVSLAKPPQGRSKPGRLMFTVPRPRCIQPAQRQLVESRKKEKKKEKFLTKRTRIP